MIKPKEKLKNCLRKLIKEKRKVLILNVFPMSSEKIPYDIACQLKDVIVKTHFAIEGFDNMEKATMCGF